MRTYLIVANQTLTSRSLTEAISARLADGPIRTHVVVPLSPVGGRLTWDEKTSRDVAQQRLDEVLARLRAMGVDADGEIGDRGPGAGGQGRDPRAGGRRGHRVDPAEGPLALARRGRPEPAARLGPGAGDRRDPERVERRRTRQANSRPSSRTSSSHARSRPIVVVGAVAREDPHARPRASSRRPSDATIASGSPPGRSTRPQPPANSVSPLNSRPSSASKRQTEPSVWPGVCRTLQSDLAEADLAALGQVDRRAPTAGCRTAPTAAAGRSGARDRAGGPRCRRRCARPPRRCRRCGPSARGWRRSA